MWNFIKKQPPVRIIALGFLLTIFLGSVLLIMPFSVREGVKLGYIDSLYTSTSAVCVTGLVTVDVGATFTPIGQVILAVLMQVGGLGVATIGAGLMLAIGKKMNLKGMNIIREASNLYSSGGLIRFVRDIFITTVIIEAAGAILSFTVFIKDMPFWTALGVSLFHSIAAFNNSGFDILGGVEGFNSFESLIKYQNNALLNISTAAMIILGGIGFLVIRELMANKFKWKKLSMHTKVVLSVNAALWIFGALLIKLTEKVSWLGAGFMSVSARTAGFTTYQLSDFTNAGLLIICVLMFIGASSGSTGGGIKTTTFFTLLLGIRSSATNRSEKAFKYSMPKDAFRKAAVITLIAILTVFTGTYLISALEPTIPFRDVFFEMVSAFGTVGLSTGITPNLCIGSKIVSMIIMYIGRLGPLTVASLWYFSRGDRFSYPEGNISIG